MTTGIIKISIFSLKNPRILSEGKANASQLVAFWLNYAHF
jgi:hypothetical protein